MVLRPRIELPVDHVTYVQSHGINVGSTTASHYRLYAYISNTPTRTSSSLSNLNAFNSEAILACDWRVQNHLFDERLPLTAPTNHQAHLPAEILELISRQWLRQTISNHSLGQHVLGGNNIMYTKITDIMVGNVDMFALFVDLWLIY